MGPDDQTTAQPIGRIPDAPPAVPTLNPADSPYTPLTLPTVDPKQIVPPEQKPVQDLGATSHAGGMAYLADQVLRGAMQGFDQAQQRKADQFNKKLAAQQSIYNDQAKQLHDMAVAGVDPNSDEFKQAQNRVLTSWQATMQTIGERIPQPKKSSKSKQGQSSDTDQSNLLQRVLNHKNDPQDALQAVYQGAIATGPPVLHQIQPYLSPAYRAKQQQAAQTQGSQASTAATTADTGATVADINNQLAHAVQSGASQDQIDALIKQRDELSPSAKFPIQGIEKYRIVNGVEHVYRVDENGKEIEGSDHVRSATASVVKPMKYIAATDTVQDPNTGKSYGANDPNLPPEIASVFQGVKRALANKSVTTTGTHTVMVQQGDTTVPVEVETTSTKTVGGGGAAHTAGPAAPSSSATPKAAHGPGVVSTGSPVGYKDSPEYKQLIKQATDAQKDFNSASTNLSTMLKTVKEAKQGDGAAQVAIVSAYLKTVVGGQGTGVRITKPEWDAAVKTRTIPEGIAATFSPDGYLTGAAISPQQVDQFINAVHQKTKALYENAQSTKQRATEQRQTDVPANLQTAPPAAPQSNSIDDEILNLVKH